MAFARRNKAKERAYNWFKEREPVYQLIQAKKVAKQAAKPQPTKQDILQQKLARVQESIKRLTTKKKRLETLLKKQLRRQKYYQNQLNLLFLG